MAITTAISDLFSSVYELFASIFHAAWMIIHGVYSAILGFVSGVLHLVGNVFHGAADLAGGISRFVLGNIVVLSIGAVAAFAYFQYTASGRRVAQGKKTN